MNRSFSLKDLVVAEDAGSLIIRCPYIRLSSALGAGSNKHIKRLRDFFLVRRFTWLLAELYFHWPSSILLMNLAKSIL